MRPRCGMSLEVQKRGKIFVHRHPEPSFNNSTRRREMACSTKKSTVGSKRLVESHSEQTPFSRTGSSITNLIYLYIKFILYL